MRILLAQNSVYVPAFGGANRSNRLLLEGLAARGHDCHAVAPACGVHACATRADFHEELRKRGIASTETGADTDAFELDGVKVRTTSGGSLVALLQRAFREINPDTILIASEDPGQVLLSAALRLAPERVVYLARTTLMLPCGPDSPVQAPARARLLSRAASVVVVSEFLRDYLARWADIASVHLPLCPNGPGPFPDYGLENSGAIVMVNPCDYKGLPIFSALARLFPTLPFAAVPTWGTTSADRATLQDLPNVRLLEPSDDMDRIFAQTRVLLVPSLWAEAKANMITEAMLRGIPVLTSDVGGNREAMHGVDYLLPVTPITRFKEPVTLDERMLPVAEMPAQDIEPWRDALAQLVATPASYQRVSRAARAAALAANEQYTVVPLEQHLEQVRARAGSSIAR